MVRLPPRAAHALNSSLVVELDGPVDPLRVTPASITARREDGRPLRAHARTAAGRVVVELEVDAALWASPPAAAIVVLAGLPSIQAVTTLDGRPLGAPVEIRFDLTPTLQRPGAVVARVIEVGGEPAPPSAALATSGALRLVLDGVLDPATLRPDDCPLFPLENGLELAPLYPATAWRCVGRRFELDLDLGPAKGRFRIDLRRFGWRDVAGGIPEPALVAEVVVS